MTVESSYYLSLFLDEAREKLHHVGELLVALEDASDREVLAQVFREIHSFKGNADTMGFADLAGLAHAMEEVLDGLRAGLVEGDAPLMRLLGRGVVALETRLGEVEAGQDGALPAGVLTELEAIAARIEWPADREPEPTDHLDAGPAFGQAGSRTWRIEITLDAHCFIKGTRAFMITTALEMLGAVLAITPSLEELDWPEAGDAFQVLLLSDADPDAIRAGLADIGEIASVVIEAHEAAGATQAPAPVPGPAGLRALARAVAAGQAALLVSVTFVPGCRMPGARAAMVVNALAAAGEVAARAPEPAQMADDGSAQVFQAVVATAAAPDALRDAIHAVGEVLMVAIEAYDVPPADGDVQAMDEGEAVVEHAVPASPVASTAPELTLPPGIAAFLDPHAPDPVAEAPAGRRARMVRIGADRLDDLTAIAERLFEANARVARLAHAGTGPLSEAAADAAELAEALLEEIAGLRRVPMDTVFGRFPRMVRELAHELGKQVNVQVLGADLEIDRALADELTDLLVHLLRNAVDHGLELPGDRHAAGKGAVGMLQLAARREAGHVVLTIADDGRGIDPRRLAEAAVRKGRLTPAEAARLDDQALLELIFDPGFSTAEAVSRVSGRGVGLDAVKMKAEALGGRLTVESTVGRGTIFQLRFASREPHAARPDERVGA